MKNAKKIIGICVLIVAVLAIAGVLLYHRFAYKADEAPVSAETIVPAETAAVTDAPETTAVPAATEIPETTDAPAADARETVPPDTVVATVNGKEITARNADSMAYLLYNYQVATEYPDYNRAIEYLIQQEVLDDHLEKGGYKQFTEEEEKAFDNEAAADWEARLDDYVNTSLTEDTDEARAEMRKQGEEYFASMHVTLEDVKEQLKQNEAMARLQKDLTGGYEPTEEEIQEVFSQYGAQYKAQYEGNVAMYEFYTRYYGYESWYVPEGYRSVIHILLEVDDDVMKAYTDAQAQLEEAQSAETVDEAAVKAAEEQLAAARAAVIASRQETIDEIYARLEKGESFQSLIAEYGTDPGMQDETTLAQGYHVHQDSILWDPAFTDGAFQEGMQKPGDVSQPVVGQYGIHILYYLQDVPGGLNMTDSIHDEIAEYLVTSKVNTAFNAEYAEWEKELEIVRNDDAIAKLNAQALAEQEAQKAAQATDAPEAQPEEQPTEAPAAEETEQSAQ